MAPAASLAIRLITPSLHPFPRQGAARSSTVRSSSSVSSSSMAVSPLPERKNHLTSTMRLTMESTSPHESSQKSVYKDSWLDKACIDYLATGIAEETGAYSDLQGYDRLVEISRKVMKGRSPMQQRDIVLKVLRSVVPGSFTKLMRFLLRPSNFTWGYYAFTTPLLFKWLVGPSEIRETEVDGVKYKSVVHIKKCRFLENSNCVGMCVNLCKLPTEEFLNKDFGATVRMSPNFEDMSCQMIFGLEPLPHNEDPALKQPCYKTECITAQKKEGSCPKLNAIFTDNVGLL